MQISKVVCYAAHCTAIASSLSFPVCRELWDANCKVFFLSFAGGKGWIEYIICKFFLGEIWALGEMNKFDWDGAGVLEWIKFEEMYGLEHTANSTWTNF